MIERQKFTVGKVAKNLREALMRYTPEKIDEFTAKAKKDVEDLKRVFTSFRGRVENTTIGEITENPGAYESWQQKLNQAAKYASDKHDHYFNIVESYDYLDDMPPNVKELDKLTTKIDELQENLKYVKYAMDSLAEAAKDFSKFYKDEDEQP